MAKFDLTKSNNSRVWDQRLQKWVEISEILPFDGTDALGDYKKDDKEETFKAHTSGAQREKIGSARYDLMPARIVNDYYAKIAEFGAKKYAPRNWEKGLPQSQIADSLQRHLWAYMEGEDNDPESKLPHVGHILWNAVALLYGYHHSLEDDRIKATR